MESGPLTKFITCTMFDSRALCAVCGASSIGRNFDAYTCLSCKAFFRRNAYNEHIRFTCRITRSCEVTVSTRRHCSACRLNKCFQQGMKRELIRSLTAINQATNNRQHLEQQPSRLTTMDLIPVHDPSSLSFEDWNLLNNIRNTYEDHCVKPFLASHERVPLAITTQPYRSRMKLQRLIDLKHKYLSVIASFIKSILQYNPTFTTTSYQAIHDNFRTLLTINATELMKSNVLKCVPWENDRVLFEIVFTENLMQRLDQHLQTSLNFLPYDPMILKLFLLTLALTSRGSPLSAKNDYHATDFTPFPREVLLVQNHYVTLLWKYIQYRLGDNDATMYSVRFIQHFLRRQMIEADMVDIIRNRNDYSQLVELIEIK